MNIFTYNENINKNAYLNWRTNYHEPIQNMNVLADGYFQSALLQIDTCLLDNSDKKADILIFPILFTANHAIELYEKSIYWSLNILLETESKLSLDHNIRGIWYETKKKIIKYGFGYGREKKEFDKMIVELENYLNELYLKLMNKSITDGHKNMDFSRYPTTRGNSDYHFYLKTLENIVIDLEILKKVYKSIYNTLSSFANYYYGLVCNEWETTHL